MEPGPVRLGPWQQGKIVRARSLLHEANLPAMYVQPEIDLMLHSLKPAEHHPPRRCRRNR